MSERLLLVDDEPELRDLWSEVLSSAGREIVLAGSVSEARARIADQGPFAVAVIDWTLPDGKGDAVVRALAGSGTRTLLVSGLGPALPHGHGADAVLGKPFRLRELVQKVAELAG